MRRQAFTLIELLVVIAILAVLAVVVVLTLNPAELLQESRDSNRISDMATLQSAISLSLGDNAAESLGSANTVYVSIPDPSATSTLGDQCQGLGLISLPATYAYHCAASSTYQSTNGTGWIPVNLSQNAFGSSIPLLPKDPVNTSSSRLYYTYATDGNGKYEVTSAFESAKYNLGGSNDLIAGDGGTLASVYEKGSKLGLEPLDYGDNSLVGYWALDEGSGSIAYDYSGNNATGSWNGTQAGTSGYYSPGKIGGWAGTAVGGADVNVPSPSFPAGMTSFTLTCWLDPSSFVNNWGGIIDWRDGSWPTMIDIESGNNTVYGSVRNGTQSASPSYTIATSTWYSIAYVHNNVATTDCLYANGLLIGCNSGVLTPQNATGTFAIGGNANLPLSGLISDVRVYNRALSAAQIAAMYNGGK